MDSSSYHILVILQVSFHQGQHMHHNGNIKILIEFHLERLGDNWDSFLVRNHLRRRIKSHLAVAKKKEEGRE